MTIKDFRFKFLQYMRFTIEGDDLEETIQEAYDSFLLQTQKDTFLEWAMDFYQHFSQDKNTIWPNMGLMKYHYALANKNKRP